MEENNNISDKIRQILEANNISVYGIYDDTIGMEQCIILQLKDIEYIKYDRLMLLDLEQECVQFISERAVAGLNEIIFRIKEGVENV